jgi:hypothetical protein
MPLDIKTQRDIAAGKTVELADVVKGKVIKINKHILELNQKQTDLVFTKSGIRSFAEQKKIREKQLRETPAADRTPVVGEGFFINKTADLLHATKKGSITLSALSALLVEAGFQPLRRVAKKAA